MMHWKKLKERRLVRIVASYLAAGWIALEVVGALVERGNLPPLAWDIALLWYIGGIGAALLIGWYHGERGDQKAPLSEVVALAAIAVAALGLSGWTVYGHVARVEAQQEARESALKLNRVAVLYFDDLSLDGSARYLADGLTEGLIDELSAVRELDVISRGGVEPFRSGELNYDSIGEALEAGTLVTGSVQPVGGSYRVGLQVVDQSGNVFQRASFELPPDQQNRANEVVVQEAARLLRGWLGQELRLRSTRAETGSVAAWALFHRAESERKDAEEHARAGEAESTAAAFDRADSLLVLAQQADPSWTDPPVLRAFMAFRRSRMATSLDELQHWVDRGLAFVRPVLASDPNHARAVEVRGTLKYWRWLQGVIADPDEAQRLFDSARADLERAVELDPGLASAYASLTHVYFNAGDLTDALIAGQRAYEEDAYLADADKVVQRNFDASYVLEQFTEAERWCEIGQHRFPENYRFAMCQLLLMTTRAAPPDPDHAWALVARVDSLAPAYQAEWEGLRARLLAGGVLARAGMADSARAVWLDARRQITPELDPALDLPYLEAHMRTLAGDDDIAIDLLKRVVAALPEIELERNWWWRELRAHPRWQELRLNE